MSFRPASSSEKRVTGGAWTKANRFYIPKWGESPGPYDVKGCFGDPQNHVSSSLWSRGNPAKPDKPGKKPTVPNPGKDRTAWMFGHTKNDMAYYRNIADSQGPGGKVPNMDTVKKRATGVKFTKYSRDQARTADMACSPGPIYKFEKSAIDYNTKKAANYRMGPAPKDPNARQDWIFGKVKHGYMYRSIPATCEKGSIVTPLSYRPRHLEVRTSRRPRQPFAKQERFGQASLKQYQGKKHTRASIGLHSPGPCYQVLNGDVAHWANSKKRVAAPAGAWCP